MNSGHPPDQERRLLFDQAAQILSGHALADGLRLCGDLLAYAAQQWDPEGREDNLAWAREIQGPLTEVLTNGQGANCARICLAFTCFLEAMAYVLQNLRDHDEAGEAAEKVRPAPPLYRADGTTLLH